MATVIVKVLLTFEKKVSVTRGGFILVRLDIHRYSIILELVKKCGKPSKRIRFTFALHNNFRLKFMTSTRKILSNSKFS